MTIIDLTIGGKLSVKNLIRYNESAYKIHKPFTALIDSISEQHGKNIDWWVSYPASRNTIAGSLFHYCCCIALLRELLLSNEHFTEIVTDSRAFKNIIEHYLSRHEKNVRVTFTRTPVKQSLTDRLRQRLKKIVWPFYAIIGLPIKHLLFFFAAKSTRYLRKPLPSEPLTLIDTFVMPDYIEKDRYYPGMTEVLSEEEKHSIWFVPHLYGFQFVQFLQTVKRLRKVDRNFILKEDFLKLGDYWCLWPYIFRVFKLNVKPSFFLGVDVSSLVREELTSFCGIGSSYVPLLNYRFAKRLKDSDVRLKSVIDWFENQNVDKGWNAGFRRFFPEVKIIGYQGFVVSGHYLCIYPSQEEKDNKVISHKVAVTGQGLVKSAGKFCADLDVCTAPAFRFQHVWRKRKYYPDENYFTILLALPMMESDYDYILQLFSSIADKIAVGSLFLVKFHPTTPGFRIKSLFNKKGFHRFKLITGDFNDCVEKADLLISNASSVCMETLAKGIPVIVVGNRHGLTHNPIPETVTEDIWRLCYTENEIVDAVDFYKNRSAEKIKMHEKIGMEIRENYFEPVTEKSVRKFLGFA